ncbi:MAG: undecaprenyl-diphosphate phosphatase [Nanoarchaeota archaeon]|mgnify:CR=1 FL=1
MELVYALILAFVQGVLEWFPVSSSGHLVLTEKLLEVFMDLSFEVALNFGTLMAIFVYFRKDIVYIVRDILEKRWDSNNAKLGFFILIGSIPAGLFGFIFRSFFDSISGNLLLMGSGWIVTSLVLFIGSSSARRSQKNFGYLKALVVGMGQAIAFIPGVSRSGMTISSGLFFGLNEKEAVKFSYLLAIPAIIGANIVTFGNKTIPVDYLIPTMVCFFVALVFMNISFRYVLNDRKNLRWFGVYTLILGIVSIVFGLV